MTPPAISVVLPVRNAQCHLREAIDSILAQTFGDFELITVDDASADESPDIIRSYRDPRIVSGGHRDHRGLAAALNRGLAMARGALIARQDADDVSVPTRLEEQAQAMASCPDLAILGSAYQLIDEHGVTLTTMRPPPSDGGIRWKMLFDNAFCHTSVMLRTDILRRAGLAYAQSFEYAEDFHLWSQLLDHGKGRNLDRALVKHRVHSEQISRVYAHRQQAGADRLAFAALTRLGLDLTPADAAALRQWHRRWPPSLTPCDLRHARLLLQALNLFERRYREVALARSVRTWYLRRLLRPASARRLGLLPTSQLLASVLWNSAFSWLFPVRRPFRPAAAAFPPKWTSP